MTATPGLPGTIATCAGARVVRDEEAPIELLRLGAAHAARGGAAGALPARDERLVALERWIGQVIAGRTSPEHLRALHGYAVWHQLRRLRSRLQGRPASRQQVKNVRDQVTAAAAFLDWLEARGLTLGTCTQAELDQWLAGNSSYLARSANFARWAVARRHASHLTAPSSRWTGPAGPLDQDRRWADARRLLHDDTCPVANRVAGLLILLYAQKLSVITALTTQHVLHKDGRTLLRLGSRPIVLPAPLDALVGALAGGRKVPGTSLLSVPSSWPFPGRRPGSPLAEDALGQRLHALGISPRQGRGGTGLCGGDGAGQRGHGPQPGVRYPGHRYPRPAGRGR